MRRVQKDPAYGVVVRRARRAGPLGPADSLTALCPPPRIAPHCPSESGAANKRVRLVPQRLACMDCGRSLTRPPQRLADLSERVADSPDRLHPLTGYVEVRRKTEKTTALNVMLRANLDEEPLRLHLGVRESISSLADVLSGTIAAAARPAGSGLAADDGSNEQARS